MWMTQKQMVATLDLALKDRAPQAYREMQASGELEAFLKGRAETIMDAAGDAAMNTSIPPEVTGLEREQAATAHWNAAWRLALEEGIADLPSDEEEKESAATAA